MPRHTQEFKDRIFLKIAEEISNLSHCAKIHVGAIAVIDNRVIITGINGTPPGHDNCDDIHVGDYDQAAHRLWADVNEVHAEQNVVNFSAKHGISIKGATLYVNLEPCVQCTKNLTTAGIKRIVYSKEYDRWTDEERSKTADFLRKSGLTIVHLLGVEDDSTAICAEQSIV
jgi:dCMP deaminase